MGIRDERLDRAAEMPHRAFAGDDRLDVRLESEFGRMFFTGKISKPEYEAGVRYANIVLLYLNTTDAPEPYGNDYLDDLWDEECLGRKLSMAAAKQILKGVDPRCSHVVDRVVVYDGPLNHGEMALLRAGLRALAGD